MDIRRLGLGLGFCLGVLLAALLPVRAQESGSGVLYLDIADPEVRGPRGWPWPFVWFSLRSGSVSDTLVVRGPGGAEVVVRTTVPGRWWLSPEQTQSLPAGPLSAWVGQVELPFTAVDLPAVLGPEDMERWRLATIRHALAVGRLDEARRLAEAWVAADPASVLARGLLAEALAAQGQAQASLETYQFVLDRTFWAIRPPSQLMRSVYGVWDDIVATLPVVPPEPPEEPEPSTPEEQDRVYGQDPNGQWATAATASSEYSTQGGYSASQLIGPPDVTRYGDSRQAWASRTADGQTEWLDLTFARPVHATAVRVRQVYNMGAVSAVELFDAAGVGNTVFSGVDTNVYVPNKIGWFVVKFPRTSQPVQRVKVTLDSPRVRGWNEVDAVQLVGLPPGAVDPPRLSYRWDAATGILEFVEWPDGFVLQRATRLMAPDWQLHAERPPVRVEQSGQPLFFRLVTTP